MRLPLFARRGDAADRFHGRAVALLLLMVAGLYGWALYPGGGAVDHVELALVSGKVPATLVRPADPKGWALGGVRKVAVTAINTAAGQEKLNDKIGFDWADVRSGAAPVPRMLLARLPRDLAGVQSVDERKRLFFQAMLPLIARVNEVVLSKRQRIEDLRARAATGRVLVAEDQAWLDSISDRYGAARGDFDDLLSRVDVVPPSLALAQAAKESGWGTSRFAQEGNAIFGQRTWRGNGIVPEDRPEDGTFKVRAFDTLIDSVWSYVTNLNTHEAYADLRRDRAAMRAAGQLVDGDRLAGTLIRYSEIGMAYIDALRTIIRVNKLEELDREPLRIAGPETLA